MERRWPGDRPLRRRHETWRYIAAFACYVAIGVAVPEFLLNSLVGIAFFVAAAWGVPVGTGWLVRRISRASGTKPATKEVRGNELGNS